ncbi:MAG: hypothetical protein JWR19_374 [Pedosphaera sp.]|nr:hypothetical protein [Pedosphaera sp.]
MNNLNSVPFGVFCIWVVSLAMVILILALIVQHLSSSIARYLFSSVWGLLVGFFIITLPWIIELCRHDNEWSIINVWPYQGAHSGPFSATLLGVLLGVGAGCFITWRRKPAQKHIGS